MPKHKKTREQKMRADERHTALATPVSTYSYSFSGSLQPKQQSTPIMKTDVLVKNDLQKTAMVSIGILLLQIVLYVLLKNHVLAINFVRY